MRSAWPRLRGGGTDDSMPTQKRSLSHRRSSTQATISTGTSLSVAYGKAHFVLSPAATEGLFALNAALFARKESKFQPTDQEFGSGPSIGVHSVRFVRKRASGLSCRSGHFHRSPARRVSVGVSGRALKRAARSNARSS